MRAQLLLLTLGLFVLLGFQQCGFRKPPPNVLLITVDALRGDHLEIRGYHRETTPELAALAREGVYFKNAVAQAPLTIPSIYMILTGNLFYRQEIPSNFKTLAERLKAKGYTTAAFVRNPLLEIDHGGVDRGFDTFYCPESVAGAGVKRKDLQAVGSEQLYAHDLKAEHLLDKANDWIRQHRKDQPFFVWIHLFDPHDPYSPPKPYDTYFDPGYKGTRDGDIRATSKDENPIWGKVAKNPPPADLNHIVALYDGEVRYASAQIGAFLTQLSAAGLRKRTLIVVSADHGESLGDHNLWGHGLSLYDSEILIPLIMVMPGTVPKGRVVSAPVESVDIVPTILSVLGDKPEAELSGVDLTPLFKEGSPVLKGEEGAFSRWINISCFRDQHWKAIDRNSGKKELYDLTRDPLEQKDLSVAEPSLMQTYLLKLDEASRREIKVKSGTGEKVEEKLKSLGYLQ